MDSISVAVAVELDDFTLDVVPGPEPPHAALPLRETNIINNRVKVTVESTNLLIHPCNMSNKIGSVLSDYCSRQYFLKESTLTPTRAFRISSLDGLKRTGLEMLLHLLK